MSKSRVQNLLSVETIKSVSEAMPYVTVRSRMAPAAEDGFHGSVTFIDCHNSTYPGSGASLSTVVSNLAGTRVGNPSSSVFSYKTEESPHLVLDTLDRRAGYRVIAANTTATHGDSYSWQIWTLYKAS